MKNRQTKLRGGRPAKISNQKDKKELKRLVNNKDGVSKRKLACRFQCTQSIPLTYQKLGQKKVFGLN